VFCFIFELGALGSSARAFLITAVDKLTALYVCAPCDGLQGIGLKRNGYKSVSQLGMYVHKKLTLGLLYHFEMECGNAEKKGVE